MARWRMASRAWAFPPPARNRSRPSWASAGPKWWRWSRPDDLKSTIHARFRDELREVSGARAFIRAHAHLPRAIASSSSADRLAICLEVLGLAPDFGPHVYSADLVTRGKPHPDIFLLAAERLSAHPAACIVIEDSPGGIRAARAAGMTAIGLCAAAHLPPNHAEALRTAGAHHIAANWHDVQAIVKPLL